MKDNIRIQKIYICSFEKTYGVNFRFNKIDKRLFVVDKNNDVAIEVATLHQYPYIRTDSMIYFLDAVERKNLLSGKRAACFECEEISFSDLDSQTLNRCKQIIDSIEEGNVFLEGNEVLNNEQYSDYIKQQLIKEQNQSKNKQKKLGKRRK